MPKLLTKTLLRNAAARLTPTRRYPERDGELYMCCAVETEVFAHGLDVDVLAHWRELLEFHGVSTDGELRHTPPVIDPRDAWSPTDEAQALRFDFLNLLAESL